MDQINEKLGMGWLPDYPDFRDYTAEHDVVPASLKRLGQKHSVKAMLTKAGVATDWWTLLKNEWIDTGAFKL